MVGLILIVGAGALAVWASDANNAGPSTSAVAAGSAAHGTSPTVEPSALATNPFIGTFSPTGSMAEARTGETATLLADGRVLIAGGGAANGHDTPSLATAELYDPKTGKFSPTGSMSRAHNVGTATLLQDGRVLVVGGGFRTGDDEKSADLYDPKTGKFSATGPESTDRWGHTATLLGDGRVLIAGGMGYGVALTSAELYDPNTGKFTPTGSMITARWRATATLLADGRVLFTGGSSDSGPGSAAFATAELYDPSTGKFTSTGSMSDARDYHTATLLTDGRVLVAGGSPSSGPTLASAELYDPATGRFASAGSMRTVRGGHTATLLADGRVLLEGSGSAELYDPLAGVFRPTGSPLIERTHATATLLQDGRVLVEGGWDSSNTVLASAELYQP
jgi:hypothetical protein